MNRKFDKNRFCIIIFALATVLAITEFIMLPEAVCIQIVSSADGGLHLPKLTAIGMLFFITMVSVGLAYSNKRSKSILELCVGCLGVISFIVLLIINLI